MPTVGDRGSFVVFQDSLTRGEQALADAGDGNAVLDLRRRWQRVMQADLNREIEQVTRRKVIGFMSDTRTRPHPQLIARPEFIAALARRARPRWRWCGVVCGSLRSGNA